ncbi:rab effector MyRIP isoform X6 [Manis pentadactyla]|uniref:rab effector MyRIP isoform X6 n=1 Tax=Manis pentadactyla TaxID=143292 RepID=UPI00255C9B8F|nr:rab effector MyRIP isoform X6 [Manis pentadactyla]
MGRKLDLSGLTNDETEHILRVVQRDFDLRRKEEERLGEIRRKLAEEHGRSSTLSRHRAFVEGCCMRCCSPFAFLVNTKRQCGDCRFSVCKSCCSFQRREKAWICCVCQQARLLKTQSLEWFYNSVKSRFRHFGSAKVLKNLYRKHRLESGTCVDLLGGSFFEANLENEGSISGSDSTFHRQLEGHSMMDTLAVALRVAEEAIEEAISKAEAYGDSLDKQNEASYLRDHKEELTEELAAAILQKIIRKQKSRSEQPMEEEPQWPQPSSSKAAGGGAMASPGSLPASTFWRSRSAFSLTREDALKTSSVETASRLLRGRGQQPREELALPGWKLADRLDLAPVLQSPDGNWLALRGGVLLATPKSGTFQALEAASSAASAYDVLGSDSEEDLDWSETSTVLCPRPRGQPRDPQPWLRQAQGSAQGPSASSAPSGLSPSPEAMFSDSETSSAESSREGGGQAGPSWWQRKTPRDLAAEKMCLQGELDVNFNPQPASRETSDNSDPGEAPHAADQQARVGRRAQVGSEEPSKELCSPSAPSQELDAHQAWADLSENDVVNEALQPETHTVTTDKKLRNRLYELAAQMNEKDTSSGEDQESEPKTEPENQKENLFSEDNSQSVQEELQKVYLAAGTVYGLEGQLNELEDAARCIHSGTDETELAHLEDQVATAAAQVHQAELQISDIESRISALTIAGLNIAPCVRLTRKRDQKQRNQVQTIDTSRQQRRKLPAPPGKAEKTEASSVTIKTFNSNFILQGSSIDRTVEWKSSSKDSPEPAQESAAMY